MDKRICWEFKGLDGEPFMRIVPVNSDLCYQLWEFADVKKKGGEVVKEWKAMDIYPWDLGVAVRKVKEYMLKRQGQASDDIIEMERVLKEVTERIEEALR